MTLRTDGRSVRLRLRVSEVESLASGRPIEETIPFAERPLRFSLETGGTDAMTVSFDGSSIRVLVSPEAAKRWAESDEVGLYGRDRGVDLVIEKDFRRTSATPGADDLHPNPKGMCG